MLGIAIINYKTYQKTKECIDSIRLTIKQPYRIYLLDNSSGNESVSFLRNEYEECEDVELLISDINHGYARGNNICINKMIDDGCEYGVVSNNDIICKAGAIDILLEDLKAHPDYLLVGPRIMNPEGGFQLSVKQQRYSKCEYLRKSTYLSHFFNKEITAEQNDVKCLKVFTEVAWVSGAFFAFDIQKMREIGMFDPGTFLFFEEYILAAKAKISGYRLGYDPNSIIVHYHAVSTGGGGNVISKRAADTSERYYLKNYTNSSRLYLFIVRGIRSLEVLYTFGKRKDWRGIAQYFVKRK